jgi:hypothetical protein
MQFCITLTFTITLFSLQKPEAATELHRQLFSLVPKGGNPSALVLPWCIAPEETDALPAASATTSSSTEPAIDLLNTPVYAIAVDVALAALHPLAEVSCARVCWLVFKLARSRCLFSCGARHEKPLQKWTGGTIHQFSNSIQKKSQDSSLRSEPQQSGVGSDLHSHFR